MSSYKTIVISYKNNESRDFSYGAIVITVKLLIFGSDLIWLDLLRPNNYEIN